MTNLVVTLNKRRRIIFSLIILFVSLASLFHFNYQITIPTYFDGKYNMLFAYGLVLYKLIELPILYYLLVHRHLLRLKNNHLDSSAFEKLQKHSKVLFFLILQGNTIFGIITYKLSGDILFFFLFMSIAFITTLLIKPNKIFL